MLCECRDERNEQREERETLEADFRRGFLVDFTGNYGLISCLSVSTWRTGRRERVGFEMELN